MSKGICRTHKKGITVIYVINLDWKNDLFSLYSKKYKGVKIQLYKTFKGVTWGQNGLLPFLGKLISLLPFFSNLIGKCPSFENRVSQNQVKKKKKNLEPYSDVFKDL